jgi:hypothetical protein
MNNDDRKYEEGKSTLPGSSLAIDTPVYTPEVFRKKKLRSQPIDSGKDGWWHRGCGGRYMFMIGNGM